MKNDNLKFKIILVFCSVILIFSFLFLHYVNAQTNQQFLVGWQAQSFVPSWYQGKIFPTRGSEVEINFELIDRGRIIDLSGIKVRWYINDKLVKNENNGLGIKSLKFVNSDYAGQETEARISLPDYRGIQLDHIVRIPVVSPEVVIESNSPDFRVGVGENLFEALPFFFNIVNLNDLSFAWVVNGESVFESDEDPSLLKLNIDSQTPSGFGVDVRVAVQNLLNQFEFASKNFRLNVQ